MVRNHVARRGLILGFAACLLSMSACGAPTDSSTAADSVVKSACQTDAQSRLDKASAPVSIGQVLPSQGVKAADAKDKSVWYIAVGLSVPSVVPKVEAFKTAAGFAGLKPVVYDGKLDVTQWNAGIQQAVAANASAIVLNGEPPALVGAGLAAAKAANIPVIAFNVVDSPLSQTPEAPIYAYGGLDVATLGADYADAALATYGCDGGDYVTIDNGTSSTLVHSKTAFQKSLNKYCPSCNVSRVTISDQSQPTSTGSQVQTQVLKNPNLKSIIADDNYATYALPALQAMSTNTVTFIGYQGQPAALENVKKGTPMLADVATITPEFEAYSITDLVLRAITGTPAKGIGGTPYQVATKASIQKDGLPWSTLGNVQAGFAKVWGIS